MLFNLQAALAFASGAAAQFCGNGLTYNWYLNTPWEYHDNQPPPSVDTSYFFTHTPAYTGVTRDINSIHSIGPSSPTNATCVVSKNPSISVNCAHAAVVFQGYIGAIEDPGRYTLFSTNYIDNMIYVWTGDKAVSGWTTSNADYSVAGPTTQAIFPPKLQGSVNINLSAGQQVPVTILWVNGGGPGVVDMNFGVPEFVFSSSSCLFNPADDKFSPLTKTIEPCPHGAAALGSGGLLTTQ